MALTATTKIANRMGVDLVFHKYGETATTDDVTVDFANEVSIEVTGDAVYATGGQEHKRIIGFNNPIEGSMTISTQIVTPALMKIITNDTTSTTVGTYTFKSRDDIPYYKITGTTIWKGEDGTVYTETITAHKCLVRQNYSAAYVGDGDPHSLDINIELLEDDTDGMLTIATTAPTSGGGGSEG